MPGSVSINGRECGPGHPPIVVAELSANHNGRIERALEIIESEPQRRRELLNRSQRFREQVCSSGLETVACAVGPIIPIFLNTPERTVQAAEELQARGFFVAAIRPPTVPQGTSRLRITVCSVHREQDLLDLLQALIDVVTPAAARK